MGIIKLGLALLKAATVGMDDEEDGAKYQTGSELADKFDQDKNDKEVTDRLEESYQAGRRV